VKLIHSYVDCQQMLSTWLAHAISRTVALVRSAGSAMSLMWLVGVGHPLATAQPLLPALTQATSVDSAMNAVGAAKAQVNTHLALEFEEIALRGPLKIKARSEILGTAAMVVMVGAPAAWYAGGAAGEANLTAPASPQAPKNPNEKPGAVVLAAWQVPAGKKPILSATHTQLIQRQAFTLLVLAQGKWFMTVREAKLACEPPGCQRRQVKAR
jgi:hypothetical protein